MIDASFRSGGATASGFLFSVMDEFSHLKADMEWRTLTSTWLVTNRHVLLRRPPDSRLEDPAVRLVYRTRTLEQDALAWVEHVLGAAELAERARFHPNPRVVVAAVEVTLDQARMFESGRGVVVPVTSHDLMAGDNPEHVETGTDVLVAGFPRGYYDTVALCPVVKAGVVASAWGPNWMGEPRFLIDARLFPGSSGSIVTTKGGRLNFVNGSMLVNSEPQVSLLGVYSGAPLLKDDPDENPLDLGVVWYATVIAEIIAVGLPFAEAAVTS